MTAGQADAPEIGCAVCGIDLDPGGFNEQALGLGERFTDYDREAAANIEAVVDGGGGHARNGADESADGNGDALGAPGGKKLRDGTKIVAAEIGRIRHRGAARAQVSNDRARQDTVVEVGVGGAPIAYQRW